MFSNSVIGFHVSNEGLYPFFNRGGGGMGVGQRVREVCDSTVIGLNLCWYITFIS